jgi:hypothetical protein
VQIGDGPAAVTGDKRCRDMPLTKKGWEGAVSRMNRESEDLPETITTFLAENTVLKMRG